MFKYQPNVQNINKMYQNISWIYKILLDIQDVLKYQLDNKMYQNINWIQLDAQNTNKINTNINEMNTNINK